jgi:hypothetical protein
MQTKSGTNFTSQNKIIRHYLKARSTYHPINFNSEIKNENHNKHLTTQSLN